MKPDDWIYDVESFPNFFCVGFQNLLDTTETGYIFEISERRNDSAELIAFLYHIGRLIGFNNMTYDWPMIDHFMKLMGQQQFVTAAQMYEKNQQLTAGGWESRFDHVIWKPSIPQIDLFSLHHLDRWGIGLKQMQFNVRARHVMDSPIPFGKWLTYEEMDLTLKYNANDIKETKTIATESIGDIEFRESFGPEFLSYSNGKIGKKIFERELKEAGVVLYTYDQAGKRKPRQTRRPYGVRLGDVILPFIKFTRADLQLNLEYIKDQVIQEWQTKGGMKCDFDLDGFHITVRLGGIHGSLEKKAVYNRDGKIFDADATSYYPSIAIVHTIYPEHLGPQFCRTYGTLKDRRLALLEEDPNRRTLKYSLNVPFGESNSPHGIFYDPAYMLAITMNGQLMLCMLAEQFANVPGVQIIQVNTDGVTIKYPPERETIVQEIYAWWQRVTGMDLEFNEYSRMFIRDANAYLAEHVNGKRKAKGAYSFDKQWEQDHSSLIIPKAVQAALLDDCDPEDFICEHDDPWDFLMFMKGNLALQDGTPLDRNIRYYISQTGSGLVALYAPLAGKTEHRRIGKHAEGQAHAIGGRGNYTCSDCGQHFTKKADFNDHNKREHCWKIRLANVFDGNLPPDLDYRYYISEANKLMIEGE